MAASSDAAALALRGRARDGGQSHSSSRTSFETAASASPVPVLATNSYLAGSSSGRRTTWSGSLPTTVGLGADGVGAGRGGNGLGPEP
eukprot:CAMPEP_0184254130 /NCGR_PEP_ID=MMETSP0977-20130417/7183_1 /TAXON_ID=483370 /ORGANISM="non described non described, Strain CCMP2097" /LENGTH=87 /DNA_ID=CAMNT_0026559663 /DNA_START=155 /DNA_END=416 /DNA_ORIENTATION=+